MAESKVQKVARKTGVKQPKLTCQCGGEQIWVKVIGSHSGRMVKQCQKCFQCESKGRK